MHTYIHTSHLFISSYKFCEKNFNPTLAFPTSSRLPNFDIITGLLYTVV